MLPEGRKKRTKFMVLIETGSNSYETELMRTTISRMRALLIALVVVCFDVYGVLSAVPQLNHVPALPMCMKREYVESDGWAVIEHDMQLFRDDNRDGMLVKTILSCNSLCCVNEMSLGW